jgi:hypothetical protein
MYTACSHIQFLLPQHIDVTVWPCAVVSPPDIQNCSNFRDVEYESLLQRANREAMMQRERKPQEEQNSFIRINGAALYEQHDAPPSSYTTEPRHRAFVNGATMK